MACHQSTRDSADIQVYLLKATFNLPTFSPNHLLLEFLPDTSDLNNGLPSPGRGSHLELKVVIGEGAGHSVWKRIEGERQTAEARRKEGEQLRSSFECFKLSMNRS
jgi:hypothetical protein